MRNIIKNVIKTFGVGRRKDVKIVWTKLEAGNERSVHKETVPNKSEISYGMRVTPENVTSLAANEIFVFGSNMRGCHDGGASECAKLYFGAIDGQAEGPQGQSYAIPTDGCGLEEIRKSVMNFLLFCKAHRQLIFLVTEIGCGTAGYHPKDIAPMFKDALGMQNIILPKQFWKYLADCHVE